MEINWRMSDILYCRIVKILTVLYVNRLIFPETPIDHHWAQRSLIGNQYHSFWKV